MEVYESIQNFTTTHRSPVSENFAFVGDIKFIALCTLGYIYMCVYGPRYMSSRKEIHLKPVMQVYNIFMIIANAYVLEEILATTVNVNWICEPASFTPTPLAVKHARAIWVYYLTKLIEYADTMFFIVRKKFTHVTFLHVYHHATMGLYLWGITTFVPTANAYIPVILNAVIHVIMYGYYFVAALGPEYSKYLWWKIHLTKLQILQFLLIIAQAVVSLYVDCNPDYSFMHWFMVVYMLTFVVLFGHFYLSRYLKKHLQAKTKDN